MKVSMFHYQLHKILSLSHLSLLSIRVGEILNANIALATEKLSVVFHCEVSEDSKNCWLLGGKFFRQKLLLSFWKDFHFHRTAIFHYGLLQYSWRNDNFELENFVLLSFPTRPDMKSTTPAFLSSSQLWRTHLLSILKYKHKIEVKIQKSAKIPLLEGEKVRLVRIPKFKYKWKYKWIFAVLFFYDLSVTMWHLRLYSVLKSGKWN